MKAQRYKNMLKNIADSNAKYNALKFMYKYLPLFIAAFYPALLIIKGVYGIDLNFWLMLGVPAATLIFVTIVRKIINRTRPYEVYNCSPLFERDGQGESFPSRHTASAFIIAMSGFAVSPLIGAGLLMIATAIGLTRILSGVHFWTDVLAGAGISVIIGFISFIII